MSSLYRFLLIGCVLIVLVLCINWYYLNRIYHKSSPHKKVILFKIPRSGSSWLTDLLNNIPGVYLSKEIVQHHDLPIENPQELLTHLIKALESPTDKYSVRDQYLPTGRYQKDFLSKHLFDSFFMSMKSIGFTLNPEFLPKNMLNDLLQVYDKNQYRILILLRTNLIKVVISEITGKKLKELCGSSNLLRSSSSSSSSFCSYRQTDKISINKLDFLQSLNRWLKRYETFFQFIETLTTDHISTKMIYYETLQISTTHEIQEIASFLSPSLLSNIPLPNGDQSYLSQWRKRGADNLEQILINYQEIDDMLALTDDEKCNILRYMLQDKLPVVYLLNHQILASIETCLFGIEQKLKSI